MHEQESTIEVASVAGLAGDDHVAVLAQLALDDHELAVTHELLDGVEQVPIALCRGRAGSAEEVCDVAPEL